MNILLATGGGNAMNAISDDERAAVLRMHGIESKCSQGCNVCPENEVCAAPTEAASPVTVH